MPERATAVQAAQIGVETTPGTAVTASKRLLSVGFKQGIKVDTKAEMSQGFKLPTAVSIGKDWTEGTFDGYAGYNDLAYLLSSVLLGVTPSGAGVDKTWSFVPAVRSSDVPKTFTLELGDANTRFSRTTHNVVTDLSLSWAKENIALSGSYMGRSLTDQTGALGAATDVANVIMQPGDTDFYLDTTSGGLGTTRLTRVIKAKLDIKGRWSPSFFADSSEDSFTTITEKGLDVTLGMTLAADAAGMGLLTPYKAGQILYPRWRTVGPATGGASPHTFTFDMAGRITKAFEPLADVDGIYAYDLEMKAVLDPGWSGGRGLVATLINTLGAL